MKQIEEIIRNTTEEEQDAMLVLKDILAHEYMDSEISYGDFFRQAPAMNPNREKITGVVCGVRVENVENSLMRDIQYLDKLVDKLTRGKAMEKILRE